MRQTNLRSYTPSLYLEAGKEGIFHLLSSKKMPVFVLLSLHEQVTSTLLTLEFMYITQTHE